MAHWFEKWEFSRKNKNQIPKEKMNENDILGATGDELTGYGVAAILIFFIFIGLGLAGAYYAQVWIMITGGIFWLMQLLD